MTTPDLLMRAPELSFFAKGPSNAAGEICITDEGLQKTSGEDCKKTGTRSLRSSRMTSTWSSRTCRKPERKKVRKWEHEQGGKTCWAMIVVSISTLRKKGFPRVLTCLRKAASVVLNFIKLKAIEFFGNFKLLEDTKNRSDSERDLPYISLPSETYERNRQSILLSVAQACCRRFVVST